MASADSYQFGDWSIEPELNRVRRGEHRRHLEPLTMNVLVQLLESAGHIVTVSELLDRNWASRSAEPGMVSRCISQIRQAFNDDARRPVYVETIRKRGYRTIAPVRAVPERSLERTDSRPERPDRIAVLPFENLSPDPDDAYFAAGMYHEVLDRLSKVRALSVTTSNIAYPNQARSLSEIAGEVGASVVLTGSLRYARGKVRIAVHLIDAATATLKWSETYTRDVADMFLIQSEIAMQIAKAMEVEFTPTEQSAMQREPTTNPHAYAIYIKAVYLLRSFKFVAAIRQLDEAVALDPGFALALAHKAYIYSIAGTSGFGATDVMSAPEARHSMCIAASLVQRVFEIDSGQALAHTAQGKVEMYNRSWDALHRHSRSGYVLDPDQVDVAFAHAWSLLDQRQHEQALRVQDRIMQRDPLNAPIPLHASIRVRMAGMQEEAIQLCRRYIHAAPADPLGYLFGALSAAIADDTPTANELTEQAEALRETSELGATELVLMMETQRRAGNLRAAGRLEDVLARITRKQTLERDVPIFYKLACRDADGAMLALQRAASEQLPSDVVRDLHNYPDNPLFDPIRKHQEFRGLVAFIAEPAPEPALPKAGLARTRR